eukprot:350208-Chlamydomonas_euryale.AAC.9
MVARLGAQLPPKVGNCRPRSARGPTGRWGKLPCMMSAAGQSPWLRPSASGLAAQRTDDPVTPAVLPAVAPALATAERRVTRQQRQRARFVMLDPCGCARRSRAAPQYCSLAPRPMHRAWGTDAYQRRGAVRRRSVTEDTVRRAFAPPRIGQPAADAMIRRRAWPAGSWRWTLRNRGEFARAAAGAIFTGPGDCAALLPG